MTKLGKILFTLIVLVVASIGVWNWYSKAKNPAETPKEQTGSGPASAEGSETLTAESLGLAETLTRPEPLAIPAPYVPKDNIIDVELSEYAGYAGIIVANGGLEPNDQSYFFKNFGFKLRIKISEEESWSALNSGKLGVSATTVDVLSVYGRQMSVVVPVQIGFSRGADGIVVDKSIKRINDLKGKTVVTGQFTEADFYLRFLTQEAGMRVKMLDGLDSPRDADAVNMLFTSDGFGAGDAFLKCVQQKSKLINGCATWAPKTTEVVDQSNGGAYILNTNRNLLIIADILIVNRGFAEANPAMVTGLVEGVLAGNRMVRDTPQQYLDVVAKAFGWSRDEAAAQLQNVHLSNLPENTAFFSGAIDAAGSFNSIYQSAMLVYGASQLSQPVDGEYFLRLDALKQVETAGKFAAQTIAIQPIRSKLPGRVETDPLLSKDVRFLYEINSDVLDLSDESNLANLKTITQMLKISPGSTILLRGHVDNASVAEFRKQGGEDFVREMALKAVDLSKRRAQGVQKVLIEKYATDKNRIEIIGRGWDEPLKPEGGDENRRVEVQWFTLE